jgi:DNA-binding response OmpR family regulator
VTKRKILLVDDDATLRAILGDALEREQFEVAHAGNGEEGVAAALSGKPDIIISDIVMPLMNGWEFCQTLRSLPSTKAVPFIFLTSLDQAPEKVLALRLGADDYLTKPFHLDTILERVRKLVGRVDHREQLVAGAEAEMAVDKLENILVDTVEFLRATKRTGVISVSSGPFKGLLYMEKGLLRHAVLGRKRGEEALLAMLRMAESQVGFKEGTFPSLPVNMKISWEEFMASLLDRGEGSAP